MARQRRTVIPITNSFVTYGRRLAAHFRCAAILILIGVWTNPAIADDAAMTVRFEQTPGRVGILIDGKIFGTYVFKDAEISRPYFCNVRTPSGTLVTRPRPIGLDDFDDHTQMHPGLWLAFGDVSGNDAWRLKAPVEHVEFVEPPRVKGDQASFVVRNRYFSNGGDSVLCDEVCRYTIVPSRNFTRLEWDSTFTPAEDESLVFGDQEEMGLGVRMASAIAEKKGQGGLLTNSDGLTTAKNVWGKAAEWCDYSGVIDGQLVGISIAGHPDNFRRCWWHARDYGFMAANPFGRKAMTGGEPSRVEVKPGENLRLRFIIIVHNGRPGDGYDPAAAVRRQRTER